MKNTKWSQKGLKIDDVALNGAFWTHKNSVVEISSKIWNPLVTDEFSSETLIANGGVKELSKKVPNVCNDECIKKCPILIKNI